MEASMKVLAASILAESLVLFTLTQNWQDTDPRKMYQGRSQTQIV